MYTLMLDVHNVDIQSFVRHEQEVSEEKLGSKSEEDNERFLISEAIKAFKDDVLSLFSDHLETETLKLVPINDMSREMTITSKKLVYDQYLNTKNQKTLTIDFSKNCLYSNSSHISNPETLKTLLHHIEKFVQGLAMNKVELFEK